MKADVRDLGNTFLRDGAGKPACEAVVLLADRYPDPPEPRPFRLSEEQPCRSTVEDLRRNMFHGPLFQMIRSGRFGRKSLSYALQRAFQRWLNGASVGHREQLIQQAQTLLAQAAALAAS